LLSDDAPHRPADDQIPDQQHNRQQKQLDEGRVGLLLADRAQLPGQDDRPRPPLPVAVAAGDHAVKHTGQLEPSALVVDRLAVLNPVRLARFLGPGEGIDDDRRFAGITGQAVQPSEGQRPAGPGGGGRIRRGRPQGCVRGGEYPYTDADRPALVSLGMAQQVEIARGIQQVGELLARQCRQSGRLFRQHPKARFLGQLGDRNLACRGQHLLFCGGQQEGRIEQFQLFLAARRGRLSLQMRRIGRPLGGLRAGQGHRLSRPRSDRRQAQRDYVPSPGAATGRAVGFVWSSLDHVADSTARQLGPSKVLGAADGP